MRSGLVSDSPLRLVSFEVVEVCCSEGKVCGDRNRRTTNMRMEAEG